MNQVEIKVSISISQHKHNSLDNIRKFISDKVAAMEDITEQEMKEHGIANISIVKVNGENHDKAGLPTD